MTSANAPSRLYIPTPFANSTNDHETVLASSGDSLNFVDGFPSAYSASNTSGGKFVTRKEINALGYLATVNEYARACGQIVTFDPALATKIGGYPRGAVLEYLNGLDYNRVISLVENNMVDFRSATDTDTYTTVTNGSVDGTNWQYIGNGDISYQETLCTIGSIGATTRQSYIPIGGFCAPRNGIPYFTGELNIVASDDATEEKTPGVQFYLFEGTTDPSSLDGVSIAGTLPTGVTKTIIYDNFSNTEGGAVLKAITAGKYYSLWASVLYCGITTNDFKLVLS